MKRTILAATCVVGLAASQMAYATEFTILSSVGGAPTGVNRVNFNDLDVTTGTTVTGLIADGPNGQVRVDIVGDGRVALGSVSGKYAAPYLSGGNGEGFADDGTDQPDGPDDTKYLTTGMDNTAPFDPTLDAGTVKLTFATPQQYIGLLWGSVDTYNTLSFYDGDNVLLGSITGNDVFESPVGNREEPGTVYVNINSDTAFKYVIASSTQYAFEFDNVAYNETPIGVPDGGSLLGIFALSLIGMASYARRRR